MKSIIEFFTKRDDHVLDYFMGVGGTLLGASLSGRQAVRIDLNSTYIDAYKLANDELGLSQQVAIIGDSLEILKFPGPYSKHLKLQKFGLIIIDPPYGDMMSRQKTGEANEEEAQYGPDPIHKSQI